MMLSAMATTLDNDAHGTGAEYIYDCIGDDTPTTEAQAYQKRVTAVVAELVKEFERRAEKLRSRR